MYISCTGKRRKKALIYECCSFILTFCLQVVFILLLDEPMGAVSALTAGNYLCQPVVVLFFVLLDVSSSDVFCRMIDYC